MATAVVHVRVEPAAAVPAAKAQLAMNKAIAAPPVAIVFALEMSAKLKWLKGRAMTILQPMGTGLVVVNLKMAAKIWRVPTLASAALHVIVCALLTTP